MRAGRDRVNLSGEGFRIGPSHVPFMLRVQDAHRPRFAALEQTFAKDLKRPIQTFICADPMAVPCVAVPLASLRFSVNLWVPQSEFNEGKANE